MTESVDVNRITRAVVKNQLLWTAGASLTSGGFLLFFGYELGATGFLISLLLVIPELAAVAGLLTRNIVRQLHDRKQTWVRFLLFSRGLSFGIPLLAFPELRPAGEAGLWVLVALLVIVSALQSVAYLAYLSWLSDLVPGVQWGSFFARRNIAKQVVLLVIPVTGGFLRDWWKTEFPHDAILWAYVICFGLGTVLQLASLLPLLKFPEVAAGELQERPATWSVFKTAWANRSLRYLCLHNWSLSFFNGLTQAAFFLYSIGPLGIGLGIYYVLHNLMVGVKIPVSEYAGRLCDHNQEKRVLAGSLFVAGNGLIFWLLAQPEQWWWLFGAYFLWGSFAAANISGRILLFKLAPSADNLSQLGLFRLVGGFWAGISGLLGGLWLDHLREANFSWSVGNFEFGSFQTIFLVSLLGRQASLLWLIPVRQPSAEES